MKLNALITIVLIGCSIIVAQERIDPKAKALFEQLSRDSSFKVIERDFKPVDLSLSNAYKQELYVAYLNKASKIVKVFKKALAGMEGQYMMTYFIVDHGKVKIVEAYFGDETGSKELQYVHVHTPEEIKLGRLDKVRKFVPLLGSEIHDDEELFIGYSVPSRQGYSWF
jgi:hypothetical protein